MIKMCRLFGEPSTRPSPAASRWPKGGICLELLGFSGMRLCTVSMSTKLMLHTTLVLGRYLL